MALLDKLDKKFANWGIPNLTLHIVIGQGIVFFLSLSEPDFIRYIALRPALVLRGEVWRLITFVFMPSTTSPVFIIFALYIFYLMGTALEHHWGTFRYNIFLLIAYVATLAVSFITPYNVATNAYIGGSVFLAFAILNPDFELALFFILPVKIKWLALLTWCYYAYSIIFGGWNGMLMVLASVVNLAIFFGKDMFTMMRSYRWRMERRAEEFAKQHQPIHQCTACGITDKDDSTVEFRYCTKCEGTLCYCQEHIKDHEHIVSNA